MRESTLPCPLLLPAVLPLLLLVLSTKTLNSVTCLQGFLKVCGFATIKKKKKEYAKVTLFQDGHTTYRCPGSHETWTDLDLFLRSWILIMVSPKALFLAHCRFQHTCFLSVRLCRIKMLSTDTMQSYVLMQSHICNSWNKCLIQWHSEIKKNAFYKFWSCVLIVQLSLGFCLFYFTCPHSKVKSWVRCACLDFSWQKLCLHFQRMLLRFNLFIPPPSSSSSWSKSEDEGSVGGDY